MAIDGDSASGRSIRTTGAALILVTCGAGACSGLLGLGDFTDQASGEGGGATTPASAAVTTTAGSGAQTTTSSGRSASTVTASSTISSGDGGGGAEGDGGAAATGGGGSGGDGGSGTGGDRPAIPCNPGTYTNADTDPCDPLDPDACPDGAHCSFADAVGNLGCVPDLEGDGAPGDVCVDDAGCAGSAHCVGGKCAPFCCPESDAPCNTILGGECGSRLNGDEEGTYVSVCFYREVCEPLQDTCSVATQNCYLYDFDTNLAVCVGSPENTAEGGACMFANSCQESSICALERGNDVCRQLCDLTDWMTSVVPTGGCPSGRTCTDAGFEGTWEHIGICRVN